MQRCISAAMALALWLRGALALAAVVEGQVCDDGKSPPNDGIGGADIVVTRPPAPPVEIVSGADGSYRVDGVTEGWVTITISKENYSKHPTQLRFQVKEGRNGVPKIFLWQDEPSAQSYHVVVARHIVNRAKESPDQAAAYTTEWIYMTAANLSPEFKWRTSSGINALDGEAKTKLPIIGDYLSMKLKSIKRLQTAADQAARELGGFPGDKFIRDNAIPPRVAAEAALWKLNDRKLSNDQRKKFFSLMQDAWPNPSPPAQVIGAWVESPNVDWSIMLRQDGQGREYDGLIQAYQVGF
jgi:hypothetical protein